MPRGIADERDSADRTVTPTGNKTKMNGFVEISTLLIHSAPKQKSNEWMHLSCHVTIYLSQSSGIFDFFIGMKTRLRGIEVHVFNGLI